MALPASTQRDEKPGEIIAYPVKSATTIYKGGLVMIDGTGYAVEASIGGGLFVGIAIEEVVNPSGGSKVVRVLKRGLHKFAKTGTITQANVGQPLGVSDDNTLVLAVANYSTNLTGHTNNDLTFTARAPLLGPLGNLITIEYVDPGGTTASLSIVVSGTRIVVNLARATSAISTIASDIITAIAANAQANALVSVANKTGNDGTGLVEALAQTNLAGGGDYVGDLETLDGSLVWVRIDRAVN